LLCGPNAEEKEEDFGFGVKREAPKFEFECYSSELLFAFLCKDRFRRLIFVLGSSIDWPGHHCESIRNRQVSK